MKVLILVLFALSLSAYAGNCRRFFYYPGEFDQLDWKNRKGWFATPQKQIFTDKQISILRKKLNRFVVSNYEFGNVYNHMEEFKKETEQNFGVNITKRILAYLQNVKERIEENTSDEYEVDFLIRNEEFRNRVIQSGHSHAAHTVTITKSEIGSSSWIQMNGARFVLEDISNALVFTDEYHGMPAPNGERLLVILFIRFNGVLNDYNDIRPSLKNEG